MALTKKQIKELEEDLKERKRKILQHLDKLQGEADAEMASPSGDSADIAALELSHRSIQNAGNRELKLLKLIDHALKKFDEGEYGICEYSGEDIPYARLKISPFAKYTVEAKEELERKERGYRKHSVDNDSFGVDSDDDDD